MGPDAGELEDDEDVRTQAILSAPIELTRDVPAFLAHQDYVASEKEKPGLGGQTERVYRDINSMVDTLALNARSLNGFVQGNALSRKQSDKSRFDLEDEEGWLIGESVDIDSLVQGIAVELDDGGSLMRLESDAES